MDPPEQDSGTKQNQNPMSEERLDNITMELQVAEEERANAMMKILLAEEAIAKLAALRKSQKQNLRRIGKCLAQAGQVPKELLEDTTQQIAAILQPTAQDTDQQTKELEALNEISTVVHYEPEEKQLTKKVQDYLTDHGDLDNLEGTFSDMKIALSLTESECANARRILSVGEKAVEKEEIPPQSTLNQPTAKDSDQQSQAELNEISTVVDDPEVEGTNSKMKIDLNLTESQPAARARISDIKKLKKIKDALKHLPAKFLEQVNGLPAEDQETLAYMISWTIAPNRETHNPSFNCGCISCYFFYFDRSESSQNRALLRDIIDTSAEICEGPSSSNKSSSKKNTCSSSFYQKKK